MTAGSGLNKQKEERKMQDAGEIHKSGLHPFWRFMYLLFAPVRGWKKIKNARYATDYYARNLFYPLLAIMAVSQFMNLYYDSTATLSRTLQMAISAFVAGFSSYFAVVALGKSFLPVNARAKIETALGKVYVMTCLSALVLAYTIFTLVPGLGAIFIVAPIYCAYLMVKGIKLLRIPAYEENATALMLTLLMLVIPMAVYFTLTLLMPDPSN